MSPDLNTINGIFAKMDSNGWDTSNDLKWGFFFLSSEREYLEGIFSELKEYNYTIENIHQNENFEWVLQVTKTEILGADKLYRRCIAFNELAETYSSYFDGWDVGKSV